MTRADSRSEEIFRGIPVSEGICHGPVFVLADASGEVPTYRIDPGRVDAELRRLEEALARTRQQLREVQERVMEVMGSQDARIFEAQLLILEDPMLLEEVARSIRKDCLNVEQIFSRVAEKYMAALEALEDDYIRERVADVRDVTARVLGNLQGREPMSVVDRMERPCVIVSHDLAPSVTAALDKEKVLGFVTDVGGRTSHTAILARSLNIPALVGAGDISRRVRSGQEILLDGYNGLAIANPSDQSLFEYGQLLERKVRADEALQELRGQPAVTADGSAVVLSANLEKVGDMPAVIEHGADGVGLFRTEFLFINRKVLPSEDEQYEAYRSVARAAAPQPVIIRTLDLGGDKLLSQLTVPSEMNPFLGWRAIRFCLQEREIFRAQLRAILRASVEGNIKVMYPMISGLEELLEANRLMDVYRAELRAEGRGFDEAMEIGTMIEIPSAAVIADELARHSKFFSIGTNDLIQYTLAVDRLNEKIAHLYQPTHPAIVRLIDATVQAAHRNGIWVGVCGEMAGDPVLVPLLLGLGVDELSAAAPVVPRIKYLIRRLRLSDARELARFALKSDSAAEILERTRSLAQSVAPKLFEGGRMPVDGPVSDGNAGASLEK